MAIFLKTYDNLFLRFFESKYVVNIFRFFLQFFRPNIYKITALTAGRDWSQALRAGPVQPVEEQAADADPRDVDQRPDVEECAEGGVRRPPRRSPRLRQVRRLDSSESMFFVSDP
jgi:hypothetical protein